MSAWIDAFLPTFGLIALGILLKRCLLRDDLLWTGLETLVFWVLLPALLAHSISTVTLSDLPLGVLAASIVAALLVATALALGLARALGQGRAATTSTVQGGIRFNNYVAFAIASGLYGQDGLALAGVVVGLVVPSAQVILTLVFAFSDERPVSALRMVARIALNPLLLGCVAGFGFAAFGGMPPGVLPFARSLGQASLALGLLCVGAGLTLASLRANTGTQLAVAGLKLLVVPAATLAISAAFHLAALPTAMVVLVMAMPTATSSYVMAKAMGGDAPLMAALITFQHVAAVLTLPIWVAVLH